MTVAVRQSVPILNVAGKFEILILIVADGFKNLGRSEVGWASWASSPNLGGSSAIAFDVHFEVCGVVDEPIDCGQGHRRIWENPVPLTEGLVRSNEQ